MSDIYLGIGIICLLGTALCALALRIGRMVSARVATALALLPLGAIALHSFVLLDEPRLAWVLPFSNLVVVGNCLPMAVGFLAGIAWRRVPPPVWRKCLVVVPLVLVCLHHSYAWLFGAPPRCGDVSADGVCVQTSPASCSAACAATILKAHGIPASEKEMAPLCLTREWGTTNHGLYRGLKLKTRGTPHDVEVFSWTFDQLRRKPPGPAILLVRLEDSANVDPVYRLEWGWVPGVTHAVVLFGFPGSDLVEMGDPAVGREKWRAGSLKVLWRGVGMRLVKR